MELLVLLLVIRDTQERPRQFEILLQNFQQFKLEDKGELMPYQLEPPAYKVVLLHLSMLDLVKTVRTGFNKTGEARKCFQKASLVSRVTPEDFSPLLQDTIF